ncbi:hypothetical protein DFR48_11574, partial [Ciceribacter lividus]
RRFFLSPTEGEIDPWPASRARRIFEREESDARGSPSP